MFSFTIVFLLGNLYLQTFSQLPTHFTIFTLIITSSLSWLGLRKRCAYLYLLIAFSLGLAWSTWYAGTILSWSLPKEFEGQPVLLTGYIASLPVTDNWGTSFTFALEELRHEKKIIRGKANLLISWRQHSPQLKVGDKWELIVRLKRIHGLQNPGAFDYEAWALQKGLRAKGYVLSNPKNKLISHSWYRYPIHQLRQILQAKIQFYLPKSSLAPWLMALIIGERNGIPPDYWQILRNTGTNHLMAIAGLHIGLIAGFAHTIVVWIWRRIYILPLWLPAPHAGAYGAITTAILYSALAGFSLPTQRACIMLAAFILTSLSKLKTSVWYSWSLALLMVILLNPLSVLTESFWLSFGTIALIIYGMHQRLAPKGFWWKWGRVQWIIGLGLIPLTLMLFQECSLISFVANSIAIPWLGFLILPFCLLSTVFLFIAPSFGALLLLIAEKSLAGLWVLLTWFSHLHFAAWHQAIPNMGIFVLLIMGILLLLLPAGFPGKGIGLIWVLPFFLYHPSKPNHGDFWLTLLDVGQGLSAVIQTKEHILIFDAGPKYNANFDMGETIVLPYLRTLHTNKIDMLVISHGDNDHIGGANALIKSMPIASIKTSVPEQFKQASYCTAGSNWQWDQVNFTFLYPDHEQLNLGNDSSCVLLIDNGIHRILLTGDIEKHAEKVLLNQEVSQLAAHILVAPHHGSKTSGLKEFIHAVNPHFVLYATGYRNRYHFPHVSVIQSYKELLTIQLNTAETGAIQFKLEKHKANAQPTLYRTSHQRYWMNDTSKNQL